MKNKSKEKSKAEVQENSRIVWCVLVDLPPITMEAKSANLYARIEPDVKEQAEEAVVTIIRVMYGGRDIDTQLKRYTRQ